MTNLSCVKAKMRWSYLNDDGGGLVRGDSGRSEEILIKPVPQDGLWRDKSLPPTMKPTLLFTVLASFTAVAPDLHAAEPKKVIVCTVTTGFRHSSIGDAEKTLKQLGADSGAFTIVDFAQQPTAQVARKPGAPNKLADLKPDADDKTRAKYEGDLKRYNDEQKR